MRLFINSVQHIFTVHLGPKTGLPPGSVDKESACDAGDPGSISGLGRSPGEGEGYPLQYSGLENPMGCIVPGVTKSWTRMSDSQFHLGPKIIRAEAFNIHELTIPG